MKFAENAIANVRKEHTRNELITRYPYSNQVELVVEKSYTNLDWVSAAKHRYRKKCVVALCHDATTEFYCLLPFVQSRAFPKSLDCTKIRVKTTEIVLLESGMLERWKSSQEAVKWSKVGQLLDSECTSSKKIPLFVAETFELVTLAGAVKPSYGLKEPVQFVPASRKVKFDQYYSNVVELYGMVRTQPPTKKQKVVHNTKCTILPVYDCE